MKNIIYYKVLIIIVLQLLFLNEGNAQQVPLYSQYYTNKFLNYPSAAGDRFDPSLFVAYRGARSNIEGAPQSMLVSYKSGLRKYLAYGINISRNTVGIFDQSSVSGGMSYLVATDGVNDFAIGASTSVTRYGVNRDILNAEDLADPILTKLLDNGGMATSMGLSLTYKSGGVSRFDFAAPELINLGFSNDAFSQIHDTNNPQLLASFEYRFTLDPRGIYARPKILLRYYGVIGLETDLLMQIDYMDLFSVSGGFRGNYGFTAGIELDLTSNLAFNFNYDIGDRDQPILADGAFEIGLGYSWRNRKSMKEARRKKGADLWSGIQADGIYDRALIPEEEEELVEEYFYSLLSAGSKKSRRTKAAENFDSALNGIKFSVMDDLEENRKRVLLAEAQAKAEAAREERLKAETSLADLNNEDSVNFLFKMDSLPLNDLANLESDTMRLNAVISPDTIEALQDEDIRDIDNIQHKYILVVGAYSIDNKWGKIFLEKIKEKYQDAKIFRSYKRNYDYVYVDAFNDFDQSIGDMKALRANTSFGDSWVHVVEKSR